MPSKRRLRPANWKTSPGRSQFDEPFLDLAQHLAAALDADPQHRRLDDRADVHPVALREPPVGEPPEAVGAAPQPPVALVDAERIAAGRDELQDLVEVGARSGRRRAGRCAPRRRAASASNGPQQAMPTRCWASTSRPPGCGASPSSVCSRIASSAARHSSTSKRLPGTSSAREGWSRRWLARPIRCRMRETPLGAPICTTRSTSPQSMPRSSEEVQTIALSAPCAHRRLDPAALLDRERAVVQRDRQVVVVVPPQLAEQDLRLGAGVDEDERGAGRLDHLVERRRGIGAVVAGPGHARVRQQDRHVGLGTRAALDQARRAGRPATDRRAARRLATVADRPTRRARGASCPAARGRAPAAGRAWRAPARAARRRSRLARRAEHRRRLGIGQQQRQQLGRGQQDVGRALRWRSRRFCGVSPVRVSAADGERRSRRSAPRDCARCRWSAP